MTTSRTSGAQSGTPRRGFTRTEMITAAAALAAGTTAYADVVTYDNSGGEFFWLSNTLDITRAADDQPGLSTASAITQNYFSDYYGGLGYGAFGYQTTYASGQAQIFSAGFSDNYAAGLNGGTMIDDSLGGGSFVSGSVFEFSFYGYDDDGYFGGERGILPEGVETYLGVRFTDVDGVHFGWIGVIRSGVEIEAFAWGYETDAGVAISAGLVPAPGALGLLAVGAIAGRGRRRED